MTKLIPAVCSALVCLSTLAASTVRIDPDAAVGPMKPEHGVGQPPLYGLGTEMFAYLKDAGVPYSRLHDVGYWHGGSHGYLTDDFLRAVLLKRQPIVDVSLGLNTTLAGVYAHQSAMRGSETQKIPLYEL